MGLLALIPMLAHSAALDLFMNQRDANNANTLTRPIAHPPGNSDGVFGYIGATQLPGFLTIGSGLTLSNGVLSAGASAAPTWASITDKPAFFSGAYGDLSDKPSLFSGAYASLTGIPATFAPAAHTQAWSTITATPTTLAGYGITDAASTSALTGYATTGSLASGLTGKFNTPTGTTAQYVRGDGSLATMPVQVQPDWNATTGLGAILNKPAIPAQRRIETYTGATNAAGQIVVTYATAYPGIPAVQPPAPALASQVWTTVSNTATGFTLQLNQRNTINLLNADVLLGATVPVAGVSAVILVVSQ